MSNSCKNCKSKTLILDPVTENLECSSCGVVQDFNNFEQQTFNSDGLIGTNIQLGKSGSRYDYSYHETKLYLSQKLISDVLLKLDLTNRFDDVNNMIKLITEDQYGFPGSAWFNVLVGACVYVVMRRANKWLPLTSVCSCVGCDSYELGRMVYNVVEHLDLRLPDFDIVGLFDRVVKEWVGKCRSGVGKEKVSRIVKQGIFLLQCMIKWSVTTGRRPVPVVVAVIVFVCQVNEVEVSIEDLASQLNVVVGTCKLRYKELLNKLVEVARVHLPWGNDVTVKNIMKNAPFVIQYMEVKSMCNSSKEIKNLEEGGVDLDGLVSDCINEGDESYFIQVCGNDRSRDWEIEDLEKLKVSPKCLSAIYLKYLEEYSRMKTSMKRIDNSRVKRSKKSDITEYYWSGDSELSKKLFLDKILEKDVGLNAMPPSFVNGCLKTEKRKEKIKAAKMRIDKIRLPPVAVSHVGDSGDLCAKPPPVNSRKRKRDAKKGDTDWEDFVIEILLLHQVKEEEIEKGHYNTLLDLHVFRSDLFSSASKILKLINHDEKSGTSPKPRNDSLMAQVNSLRQELQLLASNRHVAIVTSTSSGTRKYGIIVIVVVVGYGYAWWKGWKLPDIMFATKHSLSVTTSAVAKQLDNVYSSLAATKRHLSSRIDRVDCSLDEVAEITASTKEEVSSLRGNTKVIVLDVQSVHHAVYTLESKLNRIEGKQDDTNLGVASLLRTALTLENQASRIKANPSSSSRPGLPSPPRTISLPPVHIEEQHSSPPVSPGVKRPLASSISASSSGLKVLQEKSEIVESGNTPRVSNGLNLTEDISSNSRVFGRTFSGFGAVFSRTRPPNGQ